MSKNLNTAFIFYLRRRQAVLSRIPGLAFLFKNPAIVNTKEAKQAGKY